MKINQVIALADELKPNDFSPELKISWLNQVEGMVQTEVFLWDRIDFVTYSYPEDLERELLVSSPFDKIYAVYLSAMIDFAHGEYNKYQNTIELFNAYYDEFVRWYADNYAPADGNRATPSYYVSAYGVAVKNGYTGSEEQWLESLKGIKGDKGDPGERGEKGDKGESGIYVGAGEMPEGYTIQFDPTGDVSDIGMTIQGVDSVIRSGDITFEGFDITRTETEPDIPSGEYTEAGTYVFAEKKGYISNGNGQIIANNTWLNTPLFELSRITGNVGVFEGHALVAGVAYYSDSSRETYLGFLGQAAANALAPAVGTLTAEYIKKHAPAGTKYVSFSSAKDLTVTLSETIIPDSEIRTYVQYVIKAPKSKRSDRILHFSFDDTIASLRDLTDKSYSSVFEQPFFKALKELHDTYGAVFSCYCFYEILNSADASVVDFSLEDVTDAYAAEFAANAEWLRFGYHSKNGSMNYGTTTAEAAKTDYDKFIKQIIRITGSVNCIDLVVRLQNFSGNLASCRAMRDCACGTIGFLSGDYAETSTGGNTAYDNYTVTGYYLTTEQNSFLAKKGRYFDAAEQLFFYPSCLRLDNLYSSNVPQYMERFNTADRYARNNMLIMYCHENQMFKPTGLNADYKTRMKYVCDWAVANNYMFGFPMDKIRQAY